VLFKGQVLLRRKCDRAEILYSTQHVYTSVVAAGIDIRSNWNLNARKASWMRVSSSFESLNACIYVRSSFSTAISALVYILTTHWSRRRAGRVSRRHCQWTWHSAQSYRPARPCWCCEIRRLHLLQQKHTHTFPAINIQVHTYNSSNMHLLCIYTSTSWHTR